MSLLENLQGGQPEPTSETPNKGAEVTGTTDLSVKIAVENPISKSSEAAFLVNSSVPDFQSSEETILAENSNPAKAHEAKFQSCKGEEGFLGDFPLPKKDKQVAESDDNYRVPSFASHQQQIGVMAEEQAHLTAVAASNAADARGGTFNLPESALQSLKVNNLPTQTSGNAIHELHKTKMPGFGKRGRTYKQKTRSRPLGATEENNVPIEHNGGVRIDGRVERSHMVRERKKSKYLLYPYVDSMDIPIAGNNDKKAVSNLELEIKSSTSLSEGSKNAQDSGKSCCGLNGRDKARINHLTSAELLCELRLAAQNGRYIMDRKYSGLLKRFSSGFRRFTFLKHEDDSSQELSESQLLTKRAEESSNCTGPEERNGEDQMEYPSSSGKRKKLGRIADKTSRDIDFSCMIKNGPNGSVERGCPGTIPDASKSQAADQQQKSTTVSGIAEAKQMCRLLDLSNANISTSSAEISKVSGYGAESGNGAVERGCPVTVPDASKSQAANHQQKSKAANHQQKSKAANHQQKSKKTVSGIIEANPMNGLLDLNANISISSAEISKVTGGNDSVERGCPGTVPDASKSQAADQQRRSKTVTGIAEAYPMSRLLNLNANISTSSSEISKVTGYGAGSVKRGCPGTVPDASKSQAANQQQKSKTVSGISEANKHMSRLLVLNANISTSSAEISKVTGYGATSGNGSVEGGCPGTVADVSKSQAPDQQRKRKTFSGTTVANPMSRLLDLNANISTSSAELSKVTRYGAASGNGSVGMGCPGTVPDASKSQAADQQRKSKTVSRTTEAKPMSRLLDLNANIPTSSAVISKATRYGAASGNLEEKSLKSVSACTINNPGLPGLIGNRMTFIQLLNGVQAGVPNLVQNNVPENTAGTQSNSISNLKSRQSESEAIQVESASLVKSSLESQSAPPGFNPQQGERWRNPKIEAVNFSDNEIAASAPVMNDSVVESNSIREYTQKASSGSVPGPVKRGRKRKEEALNIPNDRRTTGVSVPNMNGMESVLPEGSLVKRRRNSSNSKVQNNVQLLTAIMLNFTSGCPLPSVESIFQAFAGYGIIHKPETRFINNSTAQVVFIQSDCAKEAFQSLQRKNPFGPVLGSYHMTPLSVATTDNNLHIQHPIQAKNQISGLQASPGMIPQQTMNQLNRLQAPPGMIPQQTTNQLNGLPSPPGMIPQQATNQLNGLSAPPGMIPRKATNQVNKLPTTPGMIPQQATNQLKGLEAPPGMIPQQATNQLNGLQAPPGMIPQKAATNQLNTLPAPPGRIPKQAKTNQLNGLPASHGMIPHQPMNTLNGLPPPPGMIPQNGEPPNLLFIKQKLEEMTSVMEKAGSNLSPEMRGKLESEIGCLKEKVNSLVGASS